MGTKRKHSASLPEEAQTQYKNGAFAKDESLNDSFAPKSTQTSSVKETPGTSGETGNATYRESLRRPAVRRQHTPADISRPLEPTPAVHSLPIDESFCPSGFNMLEILMKVATRPKPMIDIGAVDFSCAFCVCDITLPDAPIVYCSEGFERLTGYSEKEIIGKNCRFLQFPGGRVKGERPAQDVNGKTLLDLRRNISQLRETQHSIVNYKKDGTCFQNLATMIPIAWDTADMRYYVGFQADVGSLGC